MIDPIHKVMIQVADTKKAKDVILIDLSGLSDVCEYQFICSGNNPLHTVAIAEAIEKNIKQECNMRLKHSEGRESGHWIMLDYGSYQVHVFLDEIRDYYAIEDIWSKKKVLYQE